MQRPVRREKAVHKQHAHSTGQAGSGRWASNADWPNGEEGRLAEISTDRLLKEISARPDLTGALHRTGLATLCDFDCPGDDESATDVGCQVRCSDTPAARMSFEASSGCPRAHEMCNRFSECVKVVINRGNTWATLKALRMYQPRPVPICDGYLFDEGGGEPQHLSAPALVDFDVASPNESWCYRDTGYNASAQAAHRARKPEQGCTMASIKSKELADTYGKYGAHGTPSGSSRPADT